MSKLYQLTPRTEISYEDLESWLIIKLCQFQANYPDCEIYEVEEQWPGFYLHCYPGPYFDQVTRFVSSAEKDPDSEWEEKLKTTNLVVQSGAIPQVSPVVNFQQWINGEIPVLPGTHPFDPFADSSGVGKTFTRQPDGSLLESESTPHEEMDLKVGPEGGFPYSKEIEEETPARSYRDLYPLRQFEEA